MLLMSVCERHELQRMRNRLGLSCSRYQGERGERSVPTSKNASFGFFHRDSLARLGNAARQDRESCNLVRWLRSKEV